MHVKESVKEFVSDVKRRFSQKRRRDSCSTCAIDSFDGASSSSSGDSDYCLRVSCSSSSMSSIPSTPERSRFATLIRSRTLSTSSKKNQNVLRKSRRPDGKRYRIFSLDRDRRIQRSTEDSPGPSSIRDDRRMIAPLEREFPEVMDISARSAVTSSGEGSTQHSSSSSSQSSSLCDSLLQSMSQTTASTLISTASAANDVDVKLNSEPDSRPDSPDMRSDAMPSATPSMSPDNMVAPDRNLPPLPQPEIPPSPSPALVYLPRLTAPSMFLPIPNTDPLSAHLTKYVPAEQRPHRDIVGEYTGRDIHEMVMSNSWRALARMAHNRIIASDPEDLEKILDLWFLRLSSLARLRLTNQASAECTNLFAVLNAVPPPSVPGAFPGSASFGPSALYPSSPAMSVSPLSPSGLNGLAQLPGTPSQKPSTFPAGSLPNAPASTMAPRQSVRELMHPFELTVFHARVHYWSGDPLGYVDALSRILARCKQRAREEARIITQRNGLKNAIMARVPISDRPEAKKEGDKAAEENTEAAEIQDQKEDKEQGNEVDGEPTENVRDQEKTNEKEQTENSEIQDEGVKRDDILATAEANLSMWLERVARVCLILASQMIEMNEYQAAINLLVPLCTHRVPPTFQPMPSPALHLALARVYLLCGNTEKAEEHFSIAANNITDGADVVVTNAALLAAALGDWARAEGALAELVAKDPVNFTAINNLAVVLLYQGRIKEGIDLLEGALKMSPSSVAVAEPFLFNLSTLYELRSAAAIDKKRALLVEVAKWSGDGLRTSCLKMPSS